MNAQVSDLGIHVSLVCESLLLWCGGAAIRNRSRCMSAVFNELTKPYFDDMGLDEATVKGGGQPVVDALRTAGDKSLQAVIYHSDRFRPSEQFDAVTGYEKSVQDLTWSYAAYLSAARERPKPPPSGPAGP
ncbi:MAG: hypothetical protein WAK86_08965 [Pseudonocardiaceae bacterium]